MAVGRWSAHEHYLFTLGMELFGKGAWAEISMLVGTRTATQVRSHHQKWEKNRNFDFPSFVDVQFSSKIGELLCAALYVDSRW